ncbi:gas vesicle protein GvpO [Sporohalobacter salinus]|uniref:gas vesicle protein GvpO n=1 Tax=Sporohalobacter salinus TaxID=1494606 RepID=UPI001960DA63|nr:gas vesicle protein GvpO [Sporohalobacter salinus]MBM7623253.1 hypothetical protein [Sporohalobacter salinus]
MRINKVLEKLRTFFLEVLNKEIEVISIIPTEDGWNVEFEVITEDRYMRKKGRNDLIAKYEAKIDKELNITSYARKELRERGSVE